MAEIEMERDEQGQKKTKRQRENDIHKLWRTDMPTDGQRRKIKEKGQEIREANRARER
jgi:hypothetical protein